MLRDPLGLRSFSYVNLVSSKDHSAKISHDWKGIIVVELTVDLMSSFFHGTVVRLPWISGSCSSNHGELARLVRKYVLR